MKHFLMVQSLDLTRRIFAAKLINFFLAIHLIQLKLDKNLYVNIYLKHDKKCKLQDHELNHFVSLNQKKNK